MNGIGTYSTRLLITTAMAGFALEVALAQSTPGNIIDPGVILDENGVDLLSGKYYATTAAAASRDLSYEAKWFGGLDASLINSRIVVSGNSVFVSIAGATVNFNKVGSTYVPVDNKGDTLVRYASGNGFIFRNKAGDSALFDDDPSNLAGNAAGTTSASLRILRFADPTRSSIGFRYKKVTTGGLVYQRISMIAENHSEEGFDALKPAYVSNVATSADFKKLASIKAFYQGPYVFQQPCTYAADSCATTVGRQELTINTTSAGGVETISMTDKGGGVTTVKKGSHGIVSIRNPGDSSDAVFITYNGTGEVTTLTDYGRAFTYVFGTSGANRTATVTLTGGGSKYYVIDPARRILLSKRNEELETQSFAYDSEDRITQIAYPEGNAVTYAYDARSNLTQTSRVAKPGSGDATTSMTLGFPASCTSETPTCNQAIWSRDAKGVQTDYANGLIEGSYYVDEVRYPAAIVGGDRLVVKTKYATYYGEIVDGSNIREPTSVTSTELHEVSRQKAISGDFLNRVWLGKSSNGYNDELGTHEILPSSSHFSGPDGTGGTDGFNGKYLSYNTDGLLSTARMTVYPPDGPSTKFEYYFHDIMRRLTGVIGPDFDGTGAMLFPATRYTYNNRRLIEKIEMGTATAQTQAALDAMTVLRSTEHSYDANRRLIKSQVRAGGTIIAVTQFSYNALGLIECTAQRMNSAAFASLPTSACALGATGSFGPDRIVKNHYDATGRLVRAEHGFGTVDVEDEVTTTFNDNGTVATITDAKGNRTTFEYDGHDRLKKKIFPHKTSVGVSDAADYEQYWYDANDNVIQKRLRDGQSIYFTYDRLNRLTLVNFPGTESDISYTYDIENRLKSVTRGSVTNALTYDPFGRIAAESNSLGAVQYQHDEMSRLTRMTWPDGFYVTYEYNSTGPIKSIKENGSATIATYGYDSHGRRISVTYGSGAAQIYSYDAASRIGTIGHNLSGAANDLTVSLTYNPAGQIATRTGSNDAYAFTGHFNVDRSYSANGLNQFTAAGATSFGYDGRGNLTSSGSDIYGYTSDNLLKSGPGGTTLGYGGRGTLFETSKAGATTRFLYAGSALVGEYSASNVLQRRYVHGPGIDDPLLWYEGTGTTNKRYLMGDERGSITTLSDATAGLFAINRYDEFGIPGTGNSGRFQYTGQAWLPELGMYHYKARMYSPTLGRFMQTDPVGYGDGLNMYNYVSSDPINGTDPTGMTEINDRNDIIVTGSLPLPFKEPSNCLSFGGSCVSTGRDIADELAYSYAQQQERQSASPAARPWKCPTPPASRPIGAVGVYEAAFWDPTGFAMAGEVRQIAHAATREKYGRSAADDESDAYRHFYGSVALTNLIGSTRAFGILNANEVTNGKDQAAVDMDTYNNWVGVTMAQDPKFNKWTTSSIADYAIKNGCLKLSP